MKHPSDSVATIESMYADTRLYHALVLSVLLDIAAADVAEITLVAFGHGGGERRKS